MYESAVCPGRQKGQLYPGVQQAHTASWARKGVVPLCSALCSLTFSTVVKVWVPQDKNNIKPLESIQRRAMKMVKGIESKTYEKQLRLLGLLSPEQRS